MEAATGSGKLASAASWLGHELKVWGWVSAYLFVAFAAVLAYEWTGGSPPQDVSSPLVFALIRAVVIGKFVLFAKILGVATMPLEMPLWLRALIRAAGVLVVTSLFLILEEAVVALIHGESAAHGVAEFFGRGAARLSAQAFLLFVILMPLAMLMEVARVVPHDQLRAALTRRS